MKSKCCNKKVVDVLTLRYPNLSEKEKEEAFKNKNNWWVCTWCGKPADVNN